jgi:proteic killer suppression protein
MLEVAHADPDLKRLEIEAGFTAGLAPPIVKQFRLLMQIIRTVSRKDALYQHGGRRLEKLGGKRQHQYSMRLNRKYRLIVEFSGVQPDEKILIIAIENHYDD